jgi:hypothetical protein
MIGEALLYKARLPQKPRIFNPEIVKNRFSGKEGFTWPEADP